ncbi:single-stranded DNA-binding protein [uncultured Psychrobacter sp.]|uniref:single-stranded DNA-binding protein n=1 Tax=uncultured Psychrobacter sp. TaxID=259303 RepID=UPI002591910A|nr:single-stranded DNA-binding protein [uncultured Psychrobacter sp.]
MNNLNQVNITGRLGQDAEYKAFNNGGGVCSFSVAVSDTWIDKNTGQKQEHTEWVPVANFKNGADKLAQYLRKGQMVRVTGKFKTRSWEQDGQKRFKTEVVVQGFDTGIELLGSVSTPNNQGQANTGYQQPPQQPQPTQQQQQPPQAWGQQQQQAPQAPQGFNNQLSGGQPSNAKDDDVPFMPHFAG